MGPEIENSSDESDIEATEHQDGENSLDFKRDISTTTNSKHEDLLSAWMVVIVEYEGELFPGSSTMRVHDGVKVSCMQKELLCGIEVEMAFAPRWKQLSLLLCEVQERLPEQVYFLLIISITSGYKIDIILIVNTAKAMKNKT